MRILTFADLPRIRACVSPFKTHLQACAIECAGAPALALALLPGGLFVIHLESCRARPADDVLVALLRIVTGDTPFIAAARTVTAPSTRLPGWPDLPQVQCWHSSPQPKLDHYTAMGEADEVGRAELFITPHPSMPVGWAHASRHPSSEVLVAVGRLLCAHAAALRAALPQPEFDLG